MRAESHWPHASSRSGPARVRGDGAGMTETLNTPYPTLTATTTLLDALTDALRAAGAYNKKDQALPAAVLWPDVERQWEPLLPRLRERLPIFALGPYAPDHQTGPAYWLRCIIA